MNGTSLEVGPSPRTRPLVALLLFLTVSYAAGFIGAIATNSSLATWYVTLNKPTWTPPGWLFAPVWTVLYGLMGYAAWLVWSSAPGEQPSGRRSVALGLFFAQLVLNALWTWLFFGWHLLFPAFIEITVLWFAILGTMVAFWRIHPRAGALLLPYLAWVAFAAALNFAIYRMNGPRGENVIPELQQSQPKTR